MANYEILSLYSSHDDASHGNQDFIAGVLFPLFLMTSHRWRQVADFNYFVGFNFYSVTFNIPLFLSQM